MNNNIDKLPLNIQVEYLKAQLVMAVVMGQQLEVWALNHPLAGNGQTRPAMPAMDSYPDDIQERVIRTREGFENGGDVSIRLATDESEPGSIIMKLHSTNENLAMKVLESKGVFKGADGLSGLAECQEFWDNRPYGTRLYYGSGGMDYLHRDVLRAAIRALSENPAPAEIEKLREEVAKANRKLSSCEPALIECALRLEEHVLQLETLKAERDRLRYALQLWDDHFCWRHSAGVKCDHEVSSSVIEKCNKATREALAHPGHQKEGA